MQPRSELVPRIQQPPIAVRGLRKTYPGGVEAVKGIDFEVAAGEVFGLLGPNGAGKSTTIGMLTTTIVPTGGRAFVAGYDVATEPLAARSVSSVVFQDSVGDRIAIIHAGRIVALDTPRALLSMLGQEIVELRVDGDAATALALLRARGIAGEDAFTVGSTLTVPLHDRAAAHAMAAIHESDLAPSSISSRQPTLDDVYLQLTGARLAEAA